MAEPTTPAHRFDVEFLRGTWRIVAVNSDGDRVVVNGPGYGSAQDARAALDKAQPHLERVLLRIESA